MKAAIAVVLGFLIGAPILTAQDSPAKRDVIAYWTSGQLMVAGHNPYDTAALLKLERSEGYDAEKVNMPRNPPWALWLMFPLGFFDAVKAWVLWLAISLGALLVSIRCCWYLYGNGERNAKSLCLLGAVGFAPVLACLMAGQFGLILLLGVVLFLHWEATHPFLAGAALILPLAKPHLLASFFLVTLVWMITRKKWRVMAGLAAALICAILFALAIDPHVFNHYQAAMSEAVIGDLFIPSLSGTVRALLFPTKAWVQFVPMVVALAWAAWHYAKTEGWSWRTDGLLLVLVSVLTTPYEWFTDEAVLLPVVLYGALAVNRHNDRTGIARSPRWIVAALSVGLLLMTIGAVPLESGLYVWSGLVWAMWYRLGPRDEQDALQRDSFSVFTSSRTLV